jgi:ABC-2 type transport system ATP-binding protein
MQNPPRVSVVDLTLNRNGRDVLKGVSFDVMRGEIFGLLGPNGAGKTSLFHVLTGLLAPGSGRILLDGKPVRTGDATFLAQCGVVFQEPALDPRLTARENLRMAARLYGVVGKRARARVEDLLGRVELSGRADEPVSRLSGGMRRRIELARALVHQPTIRVLDEPTTGLDQTAYRKIWDHLLALREERDLTLILNTHHPDEAERCDRLAILDRGRIVASDSPERLRATVRGDLVILETDDPQTVAASVTERFGIETLVVDRSVWLEREHGHELVPRLVETFPEGTLRSVSMRRPGLGEVFVELTGRELDGEGRAEEKDA